MICSICGRKLKNPESVKAGCGPVCYRKLYGEPLRKSKTSTIGSDTVDKGQVYYIIPGQMFIEDYFIDST